MWITGLIFVLLVVLDQLTKYLTVHFSPENVVLIPKVLTITKVYNPGAAWSMLNNATWVLVLISLVASIGLGYLCRKNDWKHGKFGATALTLAFAGCVGNLIDRFLTVIHVQEGVVDMISFDLFDTIMSFIGLGSSIFNVADVFLVVGLIMFCIDYIFFYDKRMMKYGGVIPNKKKNKEIQEQIDANKEETATVALDTEAESQEEQKSEE